MRKIKFRAWCKNQKIWLHQEKENTTVREIFDLFKSLNHEESCQKDTVILEQFTGFTDHINNPIYEGDMFYIGATLHKVVFSEKGLWVAKNIPKNDYNYTGRPLWDLDLSIIEVIGTIHEDKHLLK